MRTCRDVSEMATDYLEGELSFAQRAGFRLHLMMCKHCRRYMDQLTRTIAILKAGNAADDAAPSAELLAAFRKGSAVKGSPDA